MSLPRELALNWCDLICLHQNKIGLATIQNKETAVKEEKEGGSRDVVSLAAFAYPGAKLPGFEERIAALNTRKMDEKAFLFEKILIDEIKLDETFPGAKNAFIQKMLLGIQMAIQKGFKEHKEPAFILTDRDAGTWMPYDFEANPLGRCGVAVYRPLQIKKVICKKTSEWNSSEAFKAVIAAIKRLTLEHAMTPLRIQLCERIFTRYQEDLNKRYLWPDPSRETILQQLRIDFRTAICKKDFIDALIKAARELRSPKPDGRQKFGCTLFGIFHVGDYKEARLYQLISNALGELEPKIDLDERSSPVAGLGKKI